MVVFKPEEPNSDKISPSGHRQIYRRYKGASAVLLDKLLISRNGAEDTGDNVMSLFIPVSGAVSVGVV